MPRRKPSGFSLVAFCRYCIIEAVFLLIPPPWLAEVLNSTVKIVASERPRTDVVPLRNEFDILKSQTRSQALYTEVQRLKMATAAIPHAVQELTSLSILGREFFAEAKNIASVWNHGHPCPFGKGAFEALLNMSSLGTSGIRAASECTSLSIL